jgi:hypothetical protein
MIDLRQQWPVLVLAVLAVVGYVDLKLSVSVLEARLPEAPPSGAAANDDSVVNVVQPSDPHVVAAEPPVERAPVPRSEWRCQGTIGEEVLRASIGQQAQAVLTCYEQVYAAAPDAPEGTLQLEVRVGVDGLPLDAHVGGPLQDPPLLECIQQAMSGWQFPAPVGGECAIIAAPFRLGAQD